MAKAKKIKSKKPAAPKPIPPITHISLVLDKSGSMSSQRDATIKAVDDYIDELHKSSDAKRALLTLTLFDTTSRILWDAEPVRSIVNLPFDQYTPEGGTALLDAVGTTISAISKTLKKGDRALVVILTDGEENSSTLFTHAGIQALIKEKEAEGNWTFVFLGTGVHAWTTGQSMGISPSNNNKMREGMMGQNIRAVGRSTVAYASSNQLSVQDLKAFNKAEYDTLGTQSIQDALAVPTP